MGKFNINSLISHLVSGIVLIYRYIVTYFLIFFTENIVKILNIKNTVNQKLEKNVTLRNIVRDFVLVLLVLKQMKMKIIKIMKMKIMKIMKIIKKKKKLNSNEINDESNNIVLPTKKN